MSRSSSTFSPDMHCPSVRSGTSSSALSRDETRQLFERTQQRWSQTQDQLSSAIKDRTTSPWGSAELRQKDAAISSLQRQLQSIQAEMDRYKRDLQTAEATILQQQVTIRNQSKQIENPQAPRDVMGTPRRHDNHASGWGPPAYQGYPPAFAMPPNQPHYGANPHAGSSFGNIAATSTHGNFSAHPSISATLAESNSNGNTPQAAGRVGGQRVNEYGSPAGHRFERSGAANITSGAMNMNATLTQNWTNANDPFSSNQGRASATSAARNQSTENNQEFASPDSFVSNPYPESSLVLSSAARNEVMIREGLQRIFNMAQQFAHRYANFPSTAGDYAMPQATKDRLMAAATTTTAFGLMSDRETRYLLIAKVMLQWIFKHILRYNAFSGLDANADHLMTGSKATIYQSTPPQLRFLILSNVANELKKLRERSDFASYVNHLCRQRTTQLLQIVRPMMHQPPQGEVQGVEELLQESYRVAEIMFSGTDEFSFEFPNYSKRFSNAEMINVDHVMMRYDIPTLIQMEAFVRLGTTPLVKTRRNMANGECPEQIMMKAKVLLKR